MTQSFENDSETTGSDVVLLKEGSHFRQTLGCTTRAEKDNPNDLESLLHGMALSAKVQEAESVARAAIAIILYSMA